MKYLLCTLLFGMVLLSLTPGLSAQSFEGEVRNIFFDTLRPGDFVPTPIGVEETKYIGDQFITAGDSAIMRWVTGVVQRDIDFYANFSLVTIDSFFLKMYEITDLDILGWQRLGADYLLKLEAEFPARSLRIRWRLLHTRTKQEVAKGVEEYDKMYWR